MSVFATATALTPDDGRWTATLDRSQDSRPVATGGSGLAVLPPR